MFMGILYLFLTFIFCFILVAIIKLACLGIKTLRKPPAVEEKKAPPRTEPVYYIVEKKRARKANYSEPKEIEFKK